MKDTSAGGIRATQGTFSSFKKCRFIQLDIFWMNFRDLRKA